MQLKLCINFLAFWILYWIDWSLTVFYSSDNEEEEIRAAKGSNHHRVHKIEIKARGIVHIILQAYPVRESPEN